MNIADRMAKARAARDAKRSAGNIVIKPPRRASRYHHTLSTGKRLHVRIWQAQRTFIAIVLGKSEVFKGPTWETAFKALVEHYELG